MNISQDILDSCDTVLRKAKESTESRSQGGSWGIASALARDLDRLSNHLEAGECSLSVTQIRKLREIFDFFVGYGLRTKLVKSIWRSTQAVAPSAPRDALREHKQLVTSMLVLKQLSLNPQLKASLYGNHLVDVLLAYMQLCYAPLKQLSSEANAPYPERSASNETPDGESIGKLFEESSTEESTELSVDDVIEHMLVDRSNLTADFQALRDGLYQPVLIQALGLIISNRIPKWLKNTSTNLLSKCLLRDDGLTSFLTAFADDSGDVIDSAKIEAFSRSVCRCPSFLDEDTYFQNLATQIASYLQKLSDRERRTIPYISRILDTILTEKSDFAIINIISNCFPKLINILRGRGCIPLGELSNHLRFVTRSCEILPRNSSLFEVFILFMPIYIEVAAASRVTDYDIGVLSITAVSTILTKLDDSHLVMLEILDPTSKILKTKTGVKIGDGEDGRCCYAPGELHDHYETILERMMASTGPTEAKFYLGLNKRFSDFEVDPALLGDAHDHYKLLVASLLVHLEEKASNPSEYMDNSVETLHSRFDVVYKYRRDEGEFKSILFMIEALCESAEELSEISLKRLRYMLESMKKSDIHTERCLEMSERVLREKEIIRDSPIFSEDVDGRGKLKRLLLAASISRNLLGIEWDIASMIQEDDEDRIPSVRELVLKSLEQKRVNNGRSVYGTMSDYADVKIDLVDPDIALRGHGFVQLRKLLSARDRATLDDLEFVFEVCQNAMEEEDSYVYLGAVQCFSSLVEIDTKKCLPLISEKIDVPHEDSRVSILMCESLARCLSSFGDMMPVYSKQLLETSLSLCGKEDEYLRLYGCSLLGDVVGRLHNVGHFFRQILNNLLALLIYDESKTVKKGAAVGIQKIFENTDKTLLVTEYATEVRDMHRSIKDLYRNGSFDTDVEVPLQEILLTLGDLAKHLLQSAPTFDRIGPSKH